MIKSPEQKIFRDWKRMVENIIPTQPIDCLRILELNVSNVCNFKCPFCPQSFGYSTKDNLYIGIDTIQQIKQHLDKINFQGYICIAGFGEPSLHPKIKEIIDILKDYKIQFITNGSYDSDLWNYLNNFEKLNIKVSVHEWDKVEEYRERFKNCDRVIFRNHDMKRPDMNLYNRGSNVPMDFKPTRRCCFYPFYKLMIDTDGHYLCCEADWGKTSKNKYNVFNTSIKDYFENFMVLFRKEMLCSHGRQSVSKNKCCKYCNINGQLCGSKFMHYFKDLYNGIEY